MLLSMKRFILIFLGFASCALTPQERVAKTLSIPLKSLELTNEIAILESTESLATSKGSFPLHVLHAEELPKNELFTLVTIDPFRWTQTTHFKFLINESGNIEIDGKEIEEMGLVLKNVLKSQVVYVAALSAKEQILIPFIIDPFVASIGNADFSLVTTHRKGTHFRLEGRGMIPGETIIVAETSAGKELRRHLLRASEEGTLSLKVEPIILGRLGGFANLTIQRGPSEAQINFPWGAKLEQESPHFQPLAFTAHPKQIDLASLCPKIEEKLFL